VNDRAIRGYASAVYAAADRFAGDQDGAKEHIIEALEVRFDCMLHRAECHCLSQQVSLLKVRTWGRII